MPENWETLLRFIYTHDDDWEYFKIPDSIDSKHPFVRDTELSVSEARSGFSFIRRHGLIENQGEGVIQVSSKGFEVIREQDVQREQIRSNQAIVLFTIILSIISILDIVAAELTPNTIFGKVSIGVMLSIILIALYFIAQPYIAEFR